MSDTPKTEDFISMDVYLQSLKKHFVGFILIVVAMVALMGVYGNFIKDKLYESKVTINSSYVNAEGNELTSDQIDYHKAFMNDIQSYVTSDVIMDGVSKKLNVSADKIIPTLSFDHKTDSAYITIICRTDSSKKAYQIIQEITKQLKNNTANKDFNLDISHKATLNRNQVSPQMGTYYKFAIVAGLVFGIVYIVLRAQYD